MKRKICVITGSRAEYGLLKKMLFLLKNNDKVELQLIVTGSHLSSAFGNTFKEIEKDNFNIDKKIEILLESDSSIAISKSMGLAHISFAEAYLELMPDIIFVVGDRYEIFAAVTPAFIMGIPIAHHSGGEVTIGAIDDSIRHCITKLSSLHFVAMEEYKKRVIQLGEEPNRVFLVGGLGVDNIASIELADRQQISKSTNFHFSQKNILVTFHPETLEVDKTINHLMELLEALQNFDDETSILFTLANADTLGKKFNEIIIAFANKKSNCFYSYSLGQKLYYSCLNEFDIVIGNSSSGLGEAPTFKIPTINIGNRQMGRIKADSIIDCKPDKLSILSAINLAFEEPFQEKLKNVVNPYGIGGASEKVINIITTIPLEGLTNKAFFDLI
jgi:GDP/UDP-N,N'-diacetylbacillosamine 2-epimerase (hydrolysing)